MLATGLQGSACAPRQRRLRPALARPSCEGADHGKSRPGAGADTARATPGFSTACPRPVSRQLSGLRGHAARGSGRCRLSRCGHPMRELRARSRQKLRALSLPMWRLEGFSAARRVGRADHPAVAADEQARLRADRRQVVTNGFIVGG
eukprot:4985998-Prymnesium_polylepis.2